jgi:ATP-dependent Zn protease
MKASKRIARRAIDHVMNSRVRILTLLACTTFFWAPPLIAAEEPARQAGPAAQAIFAVLPFFIIGGLLWWFLRKSQQGPFMRRSVEYYERSEQHMQKMEQIGERIAAALEKKEDK